MRKFICLICIAMGIQCLAVPIAVEENVEFVSAMCRVAGFREYYNNTVKEYAAAVDSLLTPFKEHAAIKRLNELRGQQSLSYDAVASLAAHTGIRNGHFVLLPGADLSRIDARWKSGQDVQVAELLDEVYRASGFHEFFLSNSDLYRKVQNNAESAVDKADLDWLTKFFGIEIPGRIAISLLNIGNYGLTLRCAEQPDQSVIIIGCWDTDDAGIPVFNETESLIIHEFSHPVCNPLIISNLTKFKRDIDTAAELFSDELSSQAYAGGKTMLCETMVRSVEIMYALAHADNAEDSTYIREDIKKAMASGYPYMPDVVKAMVTYQENRDRYQCIKDAQQLFVDAINAVDITQRYREIRRGQAKIIGTSIAEGAHDVIASDTLELKIFFDKPLVPGGFAANYYKNNADIFPDIAKVQIGKDQHILSVFVKTKPGKEYGIVINGWAFNTAAGFPGIGNAVFHFFTAD